MGTPALPMAASTATNSQEIMEPMVSSMPEFCITNRDVTRMKAAQPFMLMVVQIGSTKRETRGFTFTFCSAEARVTGRVAAELLVNSATAMAGDIFFITSIGFRPRASRNRGSTIKNWNRLPPMTTAVYLPRAPTMTPASIWAASWPAKARMPMGRMYRMARIRVNSTSCRPLMPFSSTSRFSVFGIKAMARPTAAAINSTDKTLPDRKGFRTLLGTTERK